MTLLDLARAQETLALRIAVVTLDTPEAREAFGCARQAARALRLAARSEELRADIAAATGPEIALILAGLAS
jgi:hypothetical protein